MDKNMLLSVLKALSDETRLNIVISLLSKDRSVLEMVDIVKKSQPNVSLALKTLREAGVIIPRKDGRFIFYSIKNRNMIMGMLKLAGLTGLRSR